MSAFKQQLAQKQQQKLSPLQIQQIKLLELNGIEIEERIDRELMDNPALDIAPDTDSSLDDDIDYTYDEDGDPIPIAAPNNDSSNDDFHDDDYIPDGDDYRDKDDIPDYKFNEPRRQQKDSREEIPFSEDDSFQEYLLTQFHLKNLTERQKQIGDYLIGNIDGDGYIRREISALADDLAIQYGIESNEKEIRDTLKIIQTLDPPGTGASDLRECLLLQLNQKVRTEKVLLAEKILNNHFDEFSKKQYEKIQKSLGINETKLKEAIDEIRALNPRPGNSLENAMETKSAQITPDFTVENQNGELIVNMNDNLPALRINPSFVTMYAQYSKSKKISTADKKEVMNFISEKIGTADWFINAIQQRQITLRKTMSAIVSLQRNFFLTGETSALKPLILKDVADASGFDISTISRVSNSKYVQTQFGVYSLKYFFSESMVNDEGEEISTREIRNILQNIVNEEDKAKPLTDDQLTEILNQKGFPLARRTVAKYREQLSIPVARMRKEL